LGLVVFCCWIEGIGLFDETIDDWLNRSVGWSVGWSVGRSVQMMTIRLKGKGHEPVRYRYPQSSIDTFARPGAQLAGVKDCGARQP
jgi:hypothetical protein